MFSASRRKKPLLKQSNELFEKQNVRREPVMPSSSEGENCKNTIVSLHYEKKDERDTSHSVVVSDTITLLKRISEGRDAPDSVLSEHFKKNRFGQKNRALISNMVFTALRYRQSLAHFAGGDDWKDIAEWLLQNVSSVSQYLEYRQQHLNELSSFEKAELPEWLYKKLNAQYPEQASLIAAAFLENAPLDIRVNTSKLDRETVIKQLREEGISCNPLPLSSLGIRLASKFPITKHPLFEKGIIEIQDEGSQLIALLTCARRNELVVDFCAGAGGKTLAMSDMMRGTGRIYAFDNSAARLNRITPRLVRANISQVVTWVIQNEKDERLKKLCQKADKVLVDAPCSGLGTLRRNPALKWQTSKEDVLTMQKKQLEILQNAAQLVKKGGSLIYATCSWLSAENEDVVTQFLKSNPEFKLVNASERLKRFHVAFKNKSEALVLNPAHDKTDGFFAVVMQKEDKKGS